MSEWRNVSSNSISYRYMGVVHWVNPGWSFVIDDAFDDHFSELAKHGKPIELQYDAHYQHNGKETLLLHIAGEPREVEPGEVIAIRPCDVPIELVHQLWPQLARYYGPPPVATKAQLARALKVDETRLQIQEAAEGVRIIHVAESAPAPKATKARKRKKG